MISRSHKVAQCILILWHTELIISLTVLQTLDLYAKLRCYNRALHKNVQNFYVAFDRELLKK